MATKQQRDSLASEFSGRLLAEEIPHEEGLEILRLAGAKYRKALHTKRAASPDALERWRRKRAETGPVGDSKLSHELRSELARKKSSRARGR